MNEAYISLLISSVLKFISMRNSLDIDLRSVGMYIIPWMASSNRNVALLFFKIGSKSWKVVSVFLNSTLYPLSIVFLALLFNVL